MRRRHKAARRDLEAPRDLAVQRKLHRVSAIGLGPRHRGDTIGNLLLNHDDGTAKRRHGLEELQDDRGSHVVGQVRHEQLGLAVQRLGDRHRRHRERVPHDEAEVGVVHGVRRENRLEFGVHLDGRHAGSFLHK